LRIAVTADLHLTSRKAHPERYHALEDILEQCVSEGIQDLIVAGDLFDAESRNYTEFDTLVKKSQYKHIHWFIIPGNHDVGFKNSHISAENVTVFSEASLHRFDLMSLSFLFVPYRKNRNMGEEISAFHPELKSNQWILIGHGDWMAGIREPNPLEPGIYMPLTHTDLISYKPNQVILGHIHKSLNGDNLYYPGSPCPLDINETGKRRFLIIDSETGTIESRIVNSEIIFYNEIFYIYPVPGESDYIQNQIISRIESWRLSNEEKAKVRIRIKLFGYSSDIKQLNATIRKCFEGFQFYDPDGLDLSQVGLSDDVERAEIAQQTAQWIRDLKWSSRNHEPDKGQILIEALRTIYKV
jgi:exonuclease SbcD